MEDEGSSDPCVSNQNTRIASLRHARSTFTQARHEWDLESSSASSASTHVRSDHSGHSSLSNTYRGSRGTHVASQPGEWEASAIIGEKVIDGRKYYLVAWNPTLEPEENLGNMRDLIDEWRRNMVSAGRSPAISKRENNGNRNKGRPKRGRGRPRKDLLVDARNSAG